MDIDKAYIEGYTIGYRAAMRSLVENDLRGLHGHFERLWLEAFETGRELGRLEAVMKTLETK